MKIKYIDKINKIHLKELKKLILFIKSKLFIIQIIFQIVKYFNIILFFHNKYINFLNI